MVSEIDNFTLNFNFYIFYTSSWDEDTFIANSLYFIIFFSNLWSNLLIISFLSSSYNLKFMNKLWKIKLNNKELLKSFQIL